jgi:hypothetical protein
MTAVAVTTIAAIATLLIVCIQMIGFVSLQPVNSTNSNQYSLIVTHKHTHLIHELSHTLSTLFLLIIAV